MRIVVSVAVLLRRLDTLELVLRFVTTVEDQGNLVPSMSVTYSKKSGRMQ